MKGVRAVFSMQQDAAPASEFRALLDAAVAERVEQPLHSTVSGVREQEAVLASYEGEMKQDYRPCVRRRSCITHIFVQR